MIFAVVLCSCLAQEDLPPSLFSLEPFSQSDSDDAEVVSPSLAHIILPIASISSPAKDSSLNNLLSEPSSSQMLQWQVSMFEVYSFSRLVSFEGISGAFKGSV
jgi:hypothetical protein